MAKPSFPRLIAVCLLVIAAPLSAVALLALTVTERKTYRVTAPYLSGEEGSQTTPLIFKEVI
ncbi:MULTISPECIES: hypothetical protein [Serratia]|uniref:hypothetical protein n=1 Tax=Serratia TaxID=613 RepID=UPI000BA1CFA5|nr:MULTISPECIES: hypothetical protein [Serratia]MBP0996366.1 hypothetical protein [Serratia fonticola]MBP1002031.1 hypothetical protein [Serratia fonticola]MBP1011240.1 hypothetical protein [Serratia fonticola]PAA98161.1 hypothetical protein CJJ13_06530 [Serratia fonticola]QXN61702.1 hypothetical protein J8M99_20605 [Serratia fonticola]